MLSKSCKITLRFTLISPLNKTKTECKVVSAVDIERISRTRTMLNPERGLSVIIGSFSHITAVGK